MEKKTKPIEPPTPPCELLVLVEKELSVLPVALPQVLGFTRAQLSPAVLLNGRVHALKDVPVQYRRVYTEITLRGTDKFPGPHRLLLEVPCDYPSALPDVRFVSGIQHFAVNPDSHRPMGEQFIDLCTPPAGEKHSIRLVLTAVLELLRRPLHPCQHCTPSFQQSVRVQSKITAVERLYRQKFAKHAELFSAPEAGLRGDVARAWFAAPLLDAIRGPVTALKAILKKEAPGIFSFPMFTAAHCAKLVAEVDSVAASGIPVQRPNSMNNYGVILNLVGMRDMFTWMQREVLQPIATLLFPEAGQFLDSHHTFIVQYAPKQDRGLDMHVDNSDVTFNVCLGKTFTGAPLNFCGILGQPKHRQFSLKYQHVLGRCVVHLGSQRHGAADIVTGSRYNLIVWNTSAVYRQSKTYHERRLQRFYRKESGPPDPVCLSFTHDRDYGRYLTYPEGQEHFKDTAWCPPEHAEHDDTHVAADALGALA